MAATSSNTISTAYEYEVFLSFRGPDTRLTFTDCLYDALVDDGVIVFRDSEDLHYGEKIAELLQAVSSSQIFMVVLSKGYASSVWCLREIEHAVSLHESTGTPKILPIFLDVTPDDVNLRSALYAEALKEHEEKHGDDQVGRWKEALKMVARLRGWEGQGQGHSKIIKSIAGEILTMVKKKEKFVTDLVGIEYRVNNVIELLDIDSQDVRLIGIHGMGGIGKTTLTKIIFNKLYHRFDKCSFIDDVCESMNRNGLLDLQKKLACDLHNSSHVENITNVDEGKRLIQRRACSKKVLIVLDDVDRIEQLDNMVVGFPISFALGSRILITTRDKGVLTNVHGIITYEVSQLNFVQAFKLFSKHAFKDDSPPHAYHNLSELIVSKTGGLPLTLSVIGAHLYNKREEIWSETLDRLNKTLPNEVLDKLMISYNALDENEKCIFLDIACFFVSKGKREATDMWKACGLYPRTAIEILTDRSLIKIRAGNNYGHGAFMDCDNAFMDCDNDDGYIWMHDQLRDLGRAIIFQESPRDVAGRSRLWDHAEALDIVRLKKRKDKVEALVLSTKWGGEPVFITDEELKCLPNLRFLILNDWIFVSDFENHISKLKCIHQPFSPNSNMLTNVYLKGLFYLELSTCFATEDFAGWKLFKVANKIKVLVLDDCGRLTRTPEIYGYLWLEGLSLHHCSEIQVTDSSIGFLKQLKSLFLGGCGRLMRLPESIGQLISLEHLDLSYMKIIELPNSIRHLKQLKVLIMDYCWIRKLPTAIGGLESLEELHANYCKLEGELPPEIGALSFLRILCLSNTHICAVPSTINLLTHLEELDLVDCLELQELPMLPSSLNRLCVRSFSLRSVSNLSTLTNLVKLHLLSGSQHGLTSSSNAMQTSLLQWVGNWSSKMEDLKLHLPIIYAPSTESGKLEHYSFNSEIVSSSFSNLQCLTKLELSHFPVDEIRLNGLQVLRYLTIKECELLKGLLISSSLKMLKQLVVSKCLQLVEIQILGELESMEIQYCGSLKRLSDLSKLRKLKKLSIDSCNELQEIGIFGDLDFLIDFQITNCRSLGRIRGSSSFNNLKSVSILNCNELQEIEFFGNLESVRDICFMDCNSLGKISGLSNYQNLDYIKIDSCNELQEIEFFVDLKFLKNFCITDCNSLRRISGLSDCKNLKIVSIHNCGELQEIEISSNLGSLVQFEMTKCNSLRKISCLSNCENLNSVSFNGCNELEKIEFSGELKSLRDFCIVDCNLLRRISGLSNCENLNSVSFNGCNELQNIAFFSDLESLRDFCIVGCNSLEKISDLSNCKNINSISIHNCNRLQEIKVFGDLESLRDFCIMGCSSLGRIGDLSNCGNLNSISIHSCNELQEFQFSGDLESLKDFCIVKCNSLKRIGNLSNCKNLNFVSIHECSELQEIEIFGDLGSLISFQIEQCISLGKIGGLSNCKNLNYVSFNRCSELQKIEFFGKLESLKDFRAVHCNSLWRIGDLSNCKNLKSVSLCSCNKLQGIEFFGDLESLRYFSIDNCNSLGKMVILSNCKKLNHVYIHNCNKLKQIEFFGDLESLREFRVVDCNSLERISGLSNSKKLDFVFIHHCHGLQVVEGINEFEALDFLSVWECGSLEQFIDVHSTKVKDDCLIDIRRCEKLPEIGSIRLAIYRERLISSR